MLELRFGSDRNADAAARLKDVGDRVEVLPDRILIYSSDGDAELSRDLRAWTANRSTSLVRRSSLEDVFLRLTGRSLIE